MTRKEIMLTLIRLNDFMAEAISVRFNEPINTYPELTESWLEKKFDRFYLVESTSNIEEEFKVFIELRYKFRSQEANKFGRGHKVFYDRYLSTTSVEIKYLEDPQAYMDLISKQLMERNVN